MRLTNWLACGMLVAAVAAMGCQGKIAHNLPPSNRLMEPGPGVGGPGPGVIAPPGQIPGGVGMMGTTAMDGGVTQATYACDGGCYGDGGMYGPGGGGSLCGMPGTSQIAFLGESGVQVSWDVSGNCLFDSTPLVVPGRQDFYQGAIYRLKVTGVPQRESVALYPTLEVAPVTPRTDAYLAHAPIPVQFTEEDFDQVISGNFVTKVVYLPDPEFQELALAGVETLVSTRLNPGEDPIEKADQRGSILAILRMGNKDLESGNRMYEGNVVPAQYSEDSYPVDGEVIYDGSHMGSMGSDCAPGQYGGVEYGGTEYGGAEYGGAASMMPQGVATAGLAPNALPPHMIASMAPHYGMPMTGTPIGLPGPPHIPLGVPAGLQSHTMKNRTRMMLPPPTERVHISVKQRPGIDYPRPVDKVHVDEVNRAPLKLIHGTVPGIVPNAARSVRAAIQGAAESCNNCDAGYCR